MKRREVTLRHLRRLHQMQPNLIQRKPINSSSSYSVLVRLFLQCIKNNPALDNLLMQAVVHKLHAL